MNAGHWVVLSAVLNLILTGNTGQDHSFFSLGRMTNRVTKPVIIIWYMENYITATTRPFKQYKIRRTNCWSPPTALARFSFQLEAHLLAVWVHDPYLPPRAHRFACEQRMLCYEENRWHAKARNYDKKIFKTSQTILLMMELSRLWLHILQHNYVIDNTWRT